MNLDQINNTVKKLHAGASYVVVYMTPAITLDGSVAYKITSKPCRLGVRYSHLKRMKGLRANPLPGNGKWVIDRFVYEDNNGFKLRITNDAFGKPKSTYVDASNNLVDPSIILNHQARSFTPIVQCIKLENVIAIKKGGEEL